ncbi:THO complex subunit 1 transcription elongation factor-domain-containing protein [Sordaria sp. MPI-SDFR-AT-0083]|nr:THO complex subunit 1 transcription elongation factor-domain-containing protein [Sordaria sp. MPI-SDFR-AT-0083]
MPSRVIESHGVPGVAAFSAFLDNLLARAETVKPTASIEPPLDKADFQDLQTQLNEALGIDPSQVGEVNDAKRTQRHAIIETAVRDTFSSLVATTSIDSPDFARVWNLFDILSILSDDEQCDPALLLWLVEELLDSQTIAGCRKVFDFLESRRERITAKHFGQKKLVILRTCNELLRRLSRALDPAFSGRVFIYLFQSFPLGDRSSVNLRGEYHVENVTTWDQEPAKAEDASADSMDVDMETQGETTQKTGDQRSTPKPGTADAKKHRDKALDLEALYPIFWSLQESFNQPKKLFEPAQFASFKSGLEATMAIFQSIKVDQSARSRDSKDKSDESKRALKRKRGEGEDDELANGFNPKYLTSRDLFKLEIGDLALRRNVLVQALIIMEFLLSVSSKGKEKIVRIKAPNKSVSHSDQQLSEEDTNWVLDMKKKIADYLKIGPEGPYFYRMVETVLSRDKNWVHWKVEGCPPIEMPAVSPQTFLDAKIAAGKLATARKMRDAPMGSMNWDFLQDEDPDEAWKKLENPERYQQPDLKTLQRKLEDAKFDIEMARDPKEKQRAVEAKNSLTWVALRVASRSRLAMFDNIDSDDNIDKIFEDKPKEDEPQEVEDTSAVADAVFPDDRKPIVVVDVSRASKLSVAKRLASQHPGVFTRVPAHITRKPQEGEKEGEDYYFVDTQTFNMMRDGDQLIEFTEGDYSQGTSRKHIQAVSEAGKVAIMEMNHDSAQQVKDWDFSARFICIEPPSPQILEPQLRETGSGLEGNEGQIQAILKDAAELAKQQKSPDFYESVINGGDDWTALEVAVYGKPITTTTDANGSAEGGNKSGGPENGGVPMSAAEGTTNEDEPTTTGAGGNGEDVPMTDVAPAPEA